jgi:hypothetical protein
MTARIEVDVTAAPLLNLIYFVAAHESAFVQVFGRRQSRINPHARAAGVGKAPRQEIAVGKSSGLTATSTSTYQGDP